METYLNILLKGITSVIILLVMTKIMGRKQVGELNIFDYVIGISIGSIAAEMTLNDDVNFFEGVLAITVYAFMSYLISIIVIKSIIARRLIIGTPLTIIDNGKILEKNLRKAKMDTNDLLEQARTNGYFDLSEIEYALLESDGKLSFLQKSKYVPLTPNDMKIKTNYKGLCANLIIDGKIIPENLRNIKKTEKWLRTRLTNMGYKKLEDLILVIIDSEEKITVYEKNKNYNEYNVLE